MSWWIFHLFWVVVVFLWSWRTGFRFYPSAEDIPILIPMALSYAFFYWWQYERNRAKKIYYR